MFDMEFIGDDYKFNRRITPRTSGNNTIYDVTYKNRRYALKHVVMKSPRDLKVVQRERDILVHMISCAKAKDCRRLANGHRFVIWLYRTVQTSPIDFHFVFTLARGGDLFEQRLLRPNGVFSESEARHYLAELSCALRFLHVACSVVHRDIKAENVLLDQDGHVILGDFNLARQIDGPSKSIRDEACGTLETVAPEAVPPNCQASFASDIYSLGMLGLELVLGVARKIPNEMSEEKVFEMIANGEREMTNGRTSEQFSRFIDRLLVKHPSSRPNVSQLRSMPFFEAVNGWPAIDWEKLVRGKLPAPKLMTPGAEIINSNSIEENSADSVWHTPLNDTDGAFQGDFLRDFNFEISSVS